jgi:hypothetical protein
MTSNVNWTVAERIAFTEPSRNDGRVLRRDANEPSDAGSIAAKTRAPFAP